jgi:hypothetical protein
MKSTLPLERCEGRNSNWKTTISHMEKKCERKLHYKTATKSEKCKCWKVNGEKFIDYYQPECEGENY